MRERPTVTVYYDAVCPICRRDRRRYERLSRGAASVEWVDVTAHAERLRARGIEPREALRSLHVEDQRGWLWQGLDAYILLMRRVTLLRPLAWLIGLAWIKPLLGVGYHRWVQRRLRREGRE
ncbi:thiol-disulfide oxidoreductase DCC family protein [Halomonas borealis]|uniref:thiol-disulfide oxidoreductase DCC family protein n=1 Tax=Halomonas borealis TaxID=2508710 RepID=UPI0010A046CF|nr:DCC1-like thiol-disulfide oxidoreductase family protein [Halomonas borealis]